MADDAVAGSVCEFFAGMGLMRVALAQASQRPPWRVRFANDCDPMKGRLYRAMFPAPARERFDGRDIRDIQASDLPCAKLWTASFPCTDLSLAGRGAGIHAGQSSAVWRLIELIDETPDERKPTHILFENVPALLTSNRGEDFRALARAVGRAGRTGFGVDAMLVDAAWFTPQSRQRVLIIATKLDSPLCPPVVEIDRLTPTRARPTRLLRALRAAPDVPWRLRALAEPPTAKLQLIDIVEAVDSPSVRWWDKARAQRFIEQAHPGHVDRLARVRDERRVATAFRRVRVLAGEKKPVWEVRDDGLAGCLRTPKGGSAVQALVDGRVGELRVRSLTPVEAARLQGIERLPAGFSDTELLFALGDAVCAPAIAWALSQLDTVQRAQTAAL